MKGFKAKSKSNLNLFCFAQVPSSSLGGAGVYEGAVSPQTALRRKITLQRFEVLDPGQKVPQSCSWKPDWPVYSTSLMLPSLPSSWLSRSMDRSICRYVGPIPGGSGSWLSHKLPQTLQPRRPETPGIRKPGAP